MKNLKIIPQSISIDIGFYELRFHIISTPYNSLNGNKINFDHFDHIEIIKLRNKSYGNRIKLVGSIKNSATSAYIQTHCKIKGITSVLNIIVFLKYKFIQNTNIQFTAYMN